jgi:hypothetical protein
MYDLTTRHVYVTTDRIDVAQNRDRWRALVNSVMNLRVQKNAVNFLTRTFSRKTLLHVVSLEMSGHKFYLKTESVILDVKLYS